MQGIEGVPSGVALNYEGFDESLSSIVRAFFEEKNIPTVGQMALLSELRRIFIYSASMFDEYLKADPLSIKERFGAFWLYFVQRPLGQRGLDSTQEQLSTYFKHIQPERSISTAKDLMFSLQNQRSMQPFNITGGSLALLHPVFAVFVDDCREIEPAWSTWDDVRDLFLVVSKGFNEKRLLSQLGRLVKYVSNISSPYTCYRSEHLRISGAVNEDLETNNVPILLIVLKKSGDTFYSGMTFYYQLLGIALLDPTTYRYPMEKRLFKRSCRPCFMLEIEGTQMRISGLAMLGQVTCQSFTHLLNLYGDANDAWDVARAFQALNKALLELGRYYRSVSDRSKDDDLSPWSSNLSCRSLIPYPLAEYTTTKQLVSNSYTYVVEGEYVVKYVRSYALEVHRAWASKQLAPELIHVQNLPGGWLEVKMEYLGSPWRQLALLPSQEECLAVISGLEIAHTVPVTIGEHTGVAVHGDARPDNVMINETSKAVMFIDFELSGLNGSSCYPHNLARSKFWPFSSGRRCVMSQEHDRSWYLVDSEYSKQALSPISNFRRRIEEHLNMPPPNLS